MAQILLIIGGGIAAYKTPELIRALTMRDISVRCLLTAAGAEFVAPLTLASLSGAPVYENLFDLKDEAEMGHIRLSREADMILVAPATADLIAKMARGMANDLASATLLASNKPIVIAPAMNMHMWSHQATQRNLALLRQDGVGCIGPEAGDMACGEYGIGRMAEPASIARDIADKLTTSSDLLARRRVVITAGPTHESIDPVRYIANRSSGKQGDALARAIAALGADVTLVSGPTELPPPSHVQTIYTTTACEMYTATLAALPADCAIMCAAVADWRLDKTHAQKLKKPDTDDAVLTLKFIQNPDILAALATHVHRPPLLIGFAAETENILKHARKKHARKACDWLIANDVSSNSNVLGGASNRVHVITHAGEDSWDEMSKEEVARRLAQNIAAYFDTAPAVAR